MNPIDAVSRAGAMLAAVLMVLAGAMLTFEVIARYFFIRPTIWAAELSQLCLIWGVLLGMAWVLGERRHITVNAVTALLPDRARQTAAILSLVVVIALSGWLVVYGWDIFYDSFARGRLTGTMLNLPRWTSEAPVPLGFAMLAAQAALEIWRLRRGAPGDARGRE
jgi:TRAP-type C4-dicarboxylate transport system permease small subunit